VKILQIVSGKEINGAMVHVDLLSRMLLQRGHEIQLLHKLNSWIALKLQDAGIFQRVSTMQRIPFGELLRVARWVREEGFDVMHTHMSRAHFFGVLLSRLTGVPVVATAHASHWQPHWRFNDLVIANSESTRRYQARYNRVPENRLVTIPCFIDWATFSTTSPESRNILRDRLRLSDDQPLIGVVGAVTPRKGQRELIAALPDLIKRFPDIRIVFVGHFKRSDKYARQLRTHLLKQKLAGRIIWAGQQPNVNQWLAACDACVVPSLKEPLGLCALEAMAAGIPVAASAVGGLVEFVITEQTGLLFNPKQPADISATVARILTDAPLRERIVPSAKQMVAEQFSPDRLTDRIEAALRSVVSSPK